MADLTELRQWHAMKAERLCRQAANLREATAGETHRKRAELKRQTDFHLAAVRALDMVPSTDDGQEWRVLVQRAEQTVSRDFGESDFDLIQRAMRPGRRVDTPTERPEDNICSLCGTLGYHRCEVAERENAASAIGGVETGGAAEPEWEHYPMEGIGMVRRRKATE
jgi:hypothetical protein